MAASLASTEAAMKLKGNITGISTKYTMLDNSTAGLQNSDLIILAGRPSMGKTALAINIGLNCAEWLKQKHEEETAKGEDSKLGSVGIFSLEMSSEQLAGRLISSKTKIKSDNIRKGELTPEDFGKLVQGNTELCSVPLFIDDTPALSISAVRTRARRLKRKENLSLLIIDYLQLIHGSKTSGENRVQEVSEVTQGLKAIAKELNIPVIALSQLSRGVEQRKDGDKRPQLSDLRDSGSIEQDADIVMFIYREEYYVARQKPNDGTPEMEKWLEKMDKHKNIADIIIAKQRNGPIGDIKLFFDYQYGKFSNLEADRDFG